MSKLQSDLQRSLHLSLAGRVNCMKMLTQILIFISVSPSLSPQNPQGIYGETQKPRRLGTPQSKNYYWASNIQKVIAWFQTPGRERCRVEVSFSTSSSLSALVTANLDRNPN